MRMSAQSPRSGRRNWESVRLSLSGWLVVVLESIRQISEHPTLGIRQSPSRFFKLSSRQTEFALDQLIHIGRDNQSVGRRIDDIPESGHVAEFHAAIRRFVGRNFERANM